MLKKMLFGFVFLLVGIVVLVFATGAYISAPKYSGEVSDHFDGKKFINPNGPTPAGTRALIKWMTNRDRGKWTEDTSSGYGPRPLSFEKDAIRITFINHSTFLIQVGGLNILTDPVWSRRTSPFSWLGPARMRKPGIRFEDLPRIHAVVISHNHYDHLDMPTMRTIAGSFHPRIFTPLGVTEYLESESIAGGTDMDWWDEVALSDSVTLQAVPAQHFSGRGMFDRDATLWCGYVLKTTRGNIYFAGDTGYNDVTFREIGARTGGMEVSLLPIGAYKPQWFMAPVHTSPEQAVQVHQDVRSKFSIGMHFGTFPLADDGQEDPVKDLEIAKEKYGVSKNEFITLREGEVRIIEQ